jgi:DNA-binding transcriptional regulator YbjK
VPPPNIARRRRLADAAIELVALQGLHGLTHRALDKHAALPAGTASNYFPTRDALLIATMQRVWELHHQDMETQVPPPGSGPRRRPSLALAAEQIAASLVEAATTHRDRYVAIFEMQSEVRRRPDLARALAELQRQSAGETSAFHAARGLPIPAPAVPGLQILYGGALLALLSMPVELVTLEQARPLARAMIYGVRPPSARSGGA